MYSGSTLPTFRCYVTICRVSLWEEWSKENDAYTCYVFSNFVFDGDLLVIRVCVVGANGCMRVVFGENGVFQILLSFDVMLNIMEYASLVSMASRCTGFSGAF
jgi:hypothetical protein